MEEIREDKELFEFEKPKKQFFGLGGAFRKAGFENRIAVQLELEKLVFIAIGLIMLMVMVYALGVEAGKSSVGRAKETVKVVPARRPVPVVNKAAPKPPAPAVTPPVAAVDEPYTIAAGSFRNKDSAVAEVGRFKSKGFDAFIKQSDPFFVVCVGSYADKTSAGSQQALARIRQVQADAYFRTK